ncbi:DotU family type IV/VI secretion system protein [Aliikangiella coralliicola]|uniref:DotU family type IV/VI secretion system protein n=1 Tax=Aliikangiella coralliicola TaxID=2592383 RepID=A0A545UCS1_9GAMM|nr:DotU family type IV/VI secretion system protein [Aliikangiella coralliicola]TQV87260.1 DotU family type IV/VI secretion system protein [Aliikangiella coralliicola]
MNTPMRLTEQNDLSLVELFIEFYQLLVEFKSSISEGYRDGKLADLNENIHPAEYMLYQLKQCLQLQETRVRKNGTAAVVSAYEKAQYAMVALADEIFLLNLRDNSNGWWKENDEQWWSNHLLEDTMYGSTLAGDNLYELIEELLKQPSFGPLEKDLASVYLMTLKLGFKGKYFDLNENADSFKEWEGYRDSLLAQCGSAGAAPRIPKLFPGAYKYNLNPLMRERLAPISRWRNLILVGLTAYAFISTIAWHLITTRLSNMLGL